MAMDGGGGGRGNCTYFIKLLSTLYFTGKSKLDFDIYQAKPLLPLPITAVYLD